MKTIFCYLDHLFSVFYRNSFTSCSISYLIKFRDVILHNGIYFSFCYCIGVLIKKCTHTILCCLRKQVARYPILKYISRNYFFKQKLEFHEKWKVHLFEYSKSKHSLSQEFKFRLEFRTGGIFLFCKKIFPRLKFYKIRSVYEKPANPIIAFAY